MNREVHVRICGSRRVRLPPATRPPARQRRREVHRSRSRPLHQTPQPGCQETQPHPPTGSPRLHRHPYPGRLNHHQSQPRSTPTGNPPHARTRRQVTIIFGLGLDDPSAGCSDVRCDFGNSPSAAHADTPPTSAVPPTRPPSSSATAVPGTKEQHREHHPPIKTVTERSRAPRAANLHQSREAGDRGPVRRRLAGANLAAQFLVSPGSSNPAGCNDRHRTAPPARCGNRLADRVRTRGRLHRAEIFPTQAKPLRYLQLRSAIRQQDRRFRLSTQPNLGNFAKNPG